MCSTSTRTTTTPRTTTNCVVLRPQVHASLMHPLGIFPVHPLCTLRRERQVMLLVFPKTFGILAMLGLFVLFPTVVWLLCCCGFGAGGSIGQQRSRFSNASTITYCCRCFRWHGAYSCNRHGEHQVLQANTRSGVFFSAASSACSRPSSSLSSASTARTAREATADPYRHLLHPPLRFGRHCKRKEERTSAD